MRETRAQSIRWTNPSVRKLLRKDENTDPTATITALARDFTQDAIDQGWAGPPFDPFELAEYKGISVVAHEGVNDARLLPSDPPRIEFNPQRSLSRVRFSIAHELGHYLFPDHHEQIRHRGQAEDDGWQLEMLCNIAAAEFLMPTGAFPEDRANDLSLTHLLELRTQFEVSTEAILRRAVQLTKKAASLFAATRTKEGIRVDYVVTSPTWSPAITAGHTIDIDSQLCRCTAVGYSVDSEETWSGETIHIQAVGTPPYPGHRFPRILGLLNPVPPPTPEAEQNLGQQLSLL